MDSFCSTKQCNEKGKESIQRECSVLSNDSKKRTIEQVNSSQEMKNPDNKSDANPENISLVLNVAVPCPIKDVERGECSVSLNDNKKQRIVKFRLFGKDIETEVDNTDLDSSMISFSVSLSIPGSEKNRGTSICADKSKEIVPALPKDFPALSLKGGDEIEWTIKKKLKKSDVEQTQNRLLIKKDSLQKHVFPYLEESEREILSNVRGCVPIMVKDCDRNCEVGLFLKKWRTGSYVVSGGDNKDVKVSNWYKSFVLPKKLKEDDVIGLKFDGCTRKLLLGLIVSKSDTDC